ncbi:uncharacterized protein AMSG_06219 [Thecamonas trahens ATCC 50062]|uniref:Uncharacterized protein n=1 Tax=Thecamonas trahens ATCC 50062 TaxID=461836 RepID=A0A0L0DCR9_THETB|nr:hypothetical protein AMSG_06219 [Thecamonas trahens ATCC 50062]KNC49916.1 hypothetical protein AMSG_06219 [Thecamonas trahens ATCC 50062]|eukprot:XP_013757396.1 hypothetical protein AMSG_06219 [Thecamonas trahens ATCC 50062]
MTPPVRHLVAALVVLVLVLAGAGIDAAGYDRAACEADKLAHPPGLPDVASGMRLVRLVTLTRHGDRTPGVPLFTSPPFNVSWSCPLVRVLADSPPVATPTAAVSFIPGRQALAGDCTTSWLTVRGAEQLRSLGAAIGAAWMDPAVPNSLAAEIAAARNRSGLVAYARSTDVARTLMSGLAFVDGLQAHSPAGDLGISSLHTIASGHDNLMPGPQCSRFGSVNRGALTATPASSFMAEPTIAAAVKTLDAVFNELNTSLPFTDPGYNWQYLMDNLQCKVCHNKTIPPAVSVALFDDIVRIASARWAFQINAPDAVKLAMGTLFFELAEMIGAQAADLDTTPVFTYLSAHDSTIAYMLAGLRAGLGGFDGVWPPYASNLHFLTYADPAHQLVVLPIYNGAILDVACAQRGDGPLPGACRINDFMALLNSSAVSFDEYPKFCRNPPSPPSPAPAPATGLAAQTQGGLIGGFLGGFTGLVAGALIMSLILRHRSPPSAATTPQEAVPEEEEIVPEEQAWVAELRAYEEQKKTAPFATGPVEVVTYAKMQEKQSSYNPLTQRYRAPSQELAARRMEQERRYAMEARSRAMARRYNILSNLSDDEQKGAQLGAVRPDIRRDGSSSPSFVGINAALVGKNRTTTNHTHYSYDIISGAKLPPNHDSLAPSIRGGHEKPVDVTEGLRTAKRRIELEAADRRFDIVTGREVAHGRASALQSVPVPDYARPAGRSPTHLPDRPGKRIINVMPTYNIINGKQYEPTPAQRRAAQRPSSRAGAPALASAYYVPGPASPAGRW